MRLSGQSDWKNYEPDLSADTLFQKGGEYLNEAKYEKAGDYYSRAALNYQNLGRQEKINIKNYLHCRNQQIYALIKTKDFEKAQSLLEASLELAQKELPAKDIVLAKIFILRGLLHHHAKDYPPSIADFKKAYSMILEINGNQHYDATTCLHYFSLQESRDKNYEKALAYLEESLQIRMNLDPPDWVQNVYAQNALAKWYYSQGRYEEQVGLYETSDSLAQKHLAPNHPIHADLLNNLANSYRRLGQLQRAIDTHQRALEIRKIAFGNNHIKLVPSYLNLSIPLIRLNQIELAKNYLDTCHQIVIKQEEVNLGYLNAVYIQKSLAYRGTPEATELLKKAIHILEKSDSPNLHRLATGYNNLGGNALTNGDFAQGQNYLLASIQIYDSLKSVRSSYVSTPYFNLGNLYYRKKEYTKAIEYYEKSYRIMQKNFPDNFSDQVEVILALGMTYREMGALVKAKEYLTKGSKLATENLGSTHSESVRSKFLLGNLFYDQKAYSLAIEMYEQVLKHDYSYQKSRSLIALTNVYKDLGQTSTALEYLDLAVAEEGLVENKGVTPNPRRGVNKWRAFKVYLECLQTRYQFYLDGKTSLLSDDALDLGFQLIDEVRSVYFFQCSELEFQKLTRAYYELALQVFLIKGKEGKEEYQNKAFWVIEKSKAALLNRTQIRKAAKVNKAVPEELLKREREIVFQYEKLFEEYQQERAFTQTEIVDKMLLWEKRKTAFLDSLEKAYPVYFEQRYLHQVIELKKLQSILLESDLALMGCFWGDSTVYLYQVLGDQSIKFRQFPASDITKDLRKINQLLSNVNELDNEKSFAENKAHFIRIAHQLYQKIWEPWEEEFSPFTQVVVLPDGALSHLPFSVLLSREMPKTTSYKNLPYLLHNHSFSYEVAASRLTNIHRPRKKKRYAGFAPEYQPSKDTPKYTTRNEENLMPLRENISEVETVSALFKGDSWLRKDAKEKTFLDIASSYSILHLAMHANANDSMPMQSFLSFYSEAKEEQTRLHVYEIAQMDLENDLVVLSACKTNGGQAVKGEGTLGLARAFQLAGSPNLISSQWLVDDRAASQIMVNFFELLNEGKSTGSALRKAKLDYLDQQSNYKAHPSFWATFSYYGQPGFKLSKHSWWQGRPFWLGLFMLLMVASGAILFRNKVKF